MGIKGLAKFIADFAPKALKAQEFSSFTGRIIAIDASMSLYQFLIAIRDAESYGSLTNEAGEATSHISGFLSRCIRLMEHGIKPVYVFDGKPPTLKGGELAKRQDKRETAEKDLAAAREAGDMEEVKKQVGRTVRVTKQQNEEVKVLLRLMGIPVVESPCEAEAQCAELTKKNKVYAAATEDADALTFGSKVVVRHLNFSEAKSKQNPVLAVTLETLLLQLELSMEQFIDFCILCGCDYCDTIRGVGAKTAYSLIKQYKDIETVVQNIDVTKYPLPENFPYKEAREFFISPEVTAGEELKLQWRDPDLEGLRKYLVDDNSFNASRVENYLNRLKKARTKSSQTRLESFFGAATVKSSSLPPVKEEPKKAKSGAKAKPEPSKPARTPGASSAKGKTSAPATKRKLSAVSKQNKGPKEAPSSSPAPSASGTIVSTPSPLPASKALSVSSPGAKAEAEGGLAKCPNGEVEENGSGESPICADITGQGSPSCSKRLKASGESEDDGDRSS